LFDLHPLIILGIAVATVVGMIIVLRINAFIALITAAIVVSLLAPGELPDKISRVAVAFGKTAGGIGIIIALAAVIGRCLIDSGAADRVVRMFMKLLGEKRAPISLMASGFVLSVPVFFDTVFYLLLPLARSMHRKTRQRYLLLILAMGAGASITHSLVPPTPGPLLIAGQLNIDLGMMIMVGLAVAIPTAVIMLFFVKWLSSKIDIPMRPIEGSAAEPEPLTDDQLPGLFISILPILLPVILISANTFTKSLADAEHAALFRQGDITWSNLSSEPTTESEYVMGLLPRDAQANIRTIAEGGQANTADVRDALNGLLGRKDFYNAEAFAGVELSDEAMKLKAKGFARVSVATVEHFNRLVLEAAFADSIEPHVWQTPRRKAASKTALIGDPNLAMLLSAAIALIVLHRQRKTSLKELSKIVETALMSGGVIILITAGGGAFGAMLQQAQIGPAIESLFAGDGVAGIAGIKLLFMGFFVATLLKFAQGSSTVSMITTSAMMASLLIDPVTGKFADVGFHPVYLAAVIGFGAQCCNWMNDSGFWIFAKMGGLTELETLKTWTVTVSLLAVVGLFVTVAFAKVLPLV
jgi:H+/gluconate symporter-like permease